MNGHEFDFEKIVDGLKIDDTVRGEHRDKLRWEMLRAFNAPEKTAGKSGFPVKGRMIMESKITRFAAAAVIVIGIVFGVQFFGRTGRVIWAKVPETVRRIRTYTFDHRLTITNTTEDSKTEIRSQMYGSTEHGWRAEQVVNGSMKVTKHILPADKMVIEIIPEMKKYTRGHLSDGQIEEFRRRTDPYQMVEGLLSLTYREIGRDVIEGIEVEGVEITDAKLATGAFDECTGRLWVSVETNLPVRIEFEGVSAGGTIRTLTVADRFDWGAVLDATTFEPQIPEDYEVLVEVDVSDDNEAAMLKGLRDFSEITNGRYPSALSILTASKEIGFGLRLNRLATGASMDAGPSREEIAKAVTIQASCLFYAKLIQDECEPAYYGDRVTAEFADAVLMRWKLCCEEGDLYRVVLGDLRTVTVDAERLAELESMPLNRQPKAIKPTPTDGAVVSPTGKLQLEWVPGMGAVDHRLYLGTQSEDLPLLAVTSEAQTEMGALDAGTTYYWRVDEIRDDGSVVTGDLWSFRTGSLIVQWSPDEGQTFDGVDDYVDLGADPAFDIAGPMTVMCWVQVSQFDVDWQAIVCKGDTAWRLSRDQGDNLHFGCTGLWPEWVHGKANVNDGAWHHVAGVYDGKTIALYVDGALDAAAETVGTPVPNQQPVCIGANPEKPGRNWNGAICDVRLYNYALSAEGIAASCQEGRGGHSETGDQLQR